MSIITMKSWSFNTKNDDTKYYFTVYSWFQMNKNNTFYNTQKRERRFQASYMNRNKIEKRFLTNLKSLFNKC